MTTLSPLSIRSLRKTALLSIASLSLLSSQSGVTAATLDERIQVATGILASRQGSMDPIPQALIDSALGVAVVSITQGGFVFGGTGGQGVVMAKTFRMPAPSTPSPVAPADPMAPALQPFVQPPAAPNTIVPETTTTKTTITRTLPDGSTVTEETVTTSTPTQVVDPVIPVDPSAPIVVPAPSVDPQIALPTAPPAPISPQRPVMVWCAPSAFDVAGGSVGFQAGVTKKDLIILLNTPESLALFTTPGKMAWDAKATGTAGAETVAAGISDLSALPVIIYSTSGGVYGGATLGGTSISLNEKTNLAAYGQSGYIRDILSGTALAPGSSRRLYEILEGSR